MISPLLTSVLESVKTVSLPQEMNPKDFKSTGQHIEIVVPKDKIRETAKIFLLREFFLESLTAVDFAECFELVYHFNHWKESLRCVIKAAIPKSQEAAPSLSDIYAIANWYEREVFDMFGLKFKNHPNLKRLLLPDSSTIHPLLKSFKGEPDGSDVEQCRKLIQEDKEGFEVITPKTNSEESNEYFINLGPQHPSTHGVLRMFLRLKGERVLSTEPIIGYVHRNHEKMAEIQEYKGFWPNIGRLDYVGAMSYNFGYAELIERAMGIEAPERTQYIRVLFTELNRISSHLLWLGTYLLDLGNFTPFFYCFEDRERIMDIIEQTTGERLTYDYFRFGGLYCDMKEDVTIQKTKAFILYFKKRLKDYHSLLTKNIIFQQRTRGIGIITKETALQYGITGPSLRASGIALDQRRQQPYSLYPKLDFDIPTETEGDAFARYKVRMSEMEQSLKIVEQIIDKIPKGDINLGKLPRNVPKGEYYGNVEAARGSFGMYLVSDGTLNPYRIKLRTPSFANLASLVTICRNCFVADIVSILGSMDVVIPEIDR